MVMESVGFYPLMASKPDLLNRGGVFFCPAVWAPKYEELIFA